MEVLRGLRHPGRGRLRPARRPAAGPAHRRRPSHRRGVLRRHRPGHAPARRHLLPVFAERGLWNRFVPSLDGYIQDRLNNPIHLPGPRHHQGAAPGSAAAGAGPPHRRGPAAAGTGTVAGLRRAVADLSVHRRSRSSASPAPSRRCATCSSSSAISSITSFSATARQRRDASADGPGRRKSAGPTEPPAGRRRCSTPAAGHRRLPPRE